MRIRINQIDFDITAVPAALRKALLMDPLIAQAVLRDAWEWDVGTQKGTTLAPVTKNGTAILPNGISFFVPRSGSDGAIVKAEAPSAKMAERLLQATGAKSLRDVIGALNQIVDPYTPSVAPALGGWVHAAIGGRHLVPMPPFMSGCLTGGLTCAFALCVCCGNTSPTWEGFIQDSENQRICGQMSALRVPLQLDLYHVHDLHIANGFRRAGLISKEKLAFVAEAYHHVSDTSNVSNTENAIARVLWSAAQSVKIIARYVIRKGWTCAQYQHANKPNHRKPPPILGTPSRRLNAVFEGCARALLHKSAADRTSPFPGQIYPATSVIRHSPSGLPLDFKIA